MPSLGFSLNRSFPFKGDCVIQGDSHYYRIDKPFRDANGKTFLGFTRIEVFGSPNVAGLIINVDPDDPQIFSTRPYYLKIKPKAP